MTYFFFKDLNDDKIEVLGITNNLNLYETPTIKLLHEHSLNENEEFYVLYIHTKGVKHYNRDINVNVTDWVNYMIYFNIQKHDTCIKSLSEYDTVGVNLQEKEDIPLHYSGNFWWSKSSYIKTLDECIYTNYNSPEFWLTEKK